MPPRSSKLIQSRLYESDKRKLKSYFTPEKWHQVYQHIYIKKISLRVYDFFMTTYSKDHNCTTFSQVPEPKQINIYTRGQNYLRTLKKRSFDPFKRKNRVLDGDDMFEFGYGDEVVETAVCQLFFYQFIHENNVMNYVDEHLNEILDALKEHELLKKQHREAMRRQKKKVVRRKSAPASNITKTNYVKTKVKL